MSKESGEGGWMLIKGKPNQKRGKRSDDDPRVDDEKKRDKLAGRLQKRYGVIRDEVEKHVRDWERGF